MDGHFRRVHQREKRLLFQRLRPTIPKPCIAPGRCKIEGALRRPSVRAWPKLRGSPSSSSPKQVLEEVSLSDRTPDTWKPTLSSTRLWLRMSHALLYSNETELYSLLPSLVR